MTPQDGPDQPGTAVADGRTLVLANRSRGDSLFRRFRSAAGAVHCSRPCSSISFNQSGAEPRSRSRHLKGRDPMISGYSNPLRLRNVRARSLDFSTEARPSASSGGYCNFDPGATMASFGTGENETLAFFFVRAADARKPLVNVAGHRRTRRTGVRAAVRDGGLDVPRPSPACLSAARAPRPGRLREGSPWGPDENLPMSADPDALPRRESAPPVAAPSNQFAPAAEVEPSSDPGGPVRAEDWRASPFARSSAPSRAVNVPPLSAVAPLPRD